MTERVIDMWCSTPTNVVSCVVRAPSGHQDDAATRFDYLDCLQLFLAILNAYSSRGMCIVKRFAAHIPQARQLIARNAMLFPTDPFIPS